MSTFLPVDPVLRYIQSTYSHWTHLRAILTLSSSSDKGDNGEIKVSLPCDVWYVPEINCLLSTTQLHHGQPL
jgi:hypothetical protein